jgi:hypothetical protein
MDGMTDELKAFNETTRGISFTEVMQESLCDNPHADVESSYYIKTLQSWILQFLPILYYMNQSFDETVRSILSCFARNFITIIQGRNVSSYYLYNILQAKFLYIYPYNQWIIDNHKANKESHGIIDKWLRYLYEQLIKPNLLLWSLETRIYPFFELLASIKVNVGSYMKEIKALQNAAQDGDRMFFNMFSVIATEKENPPQNLDAANCKYLPVRNGIIEFLENDYIFHEDNYRILINGFTNIIYDKDYQEKLKTEATLQYYYQKAKDIIHSIYPIEEERNYMLSLFSSVLVGDVQKDMFIELFGLGGDGKTTICNLIMSMLGSSDFGSEIQLNKDGKTETFINPAGLACTMQTFNILAQSRDGHNEGGTVNLPGKRFCSMQEPETRNTKLNCSMIKELTGGTTMIARGIYKSAFAFKPNALIILQTNKIFEYSEDDTDAIRRRISVVYHHAKFYTEKTKERLEKLEYSRVADSSVSEMIRSDPLLWQATFYILLPYALKLKKKPISDISIPASIRETTEESFNDASSINGFFNSNIKKSPNKVISFLILRDMIIEENDREKSIGGTLLQGTQRGRKQKEAAAKIFNKYTGYIHKLKRSYLKNEFNEASGPLEYLTVEYFNSQEEDIRKYFGTALNNDTQINPKIMFILDHELKKED